MNFITRYINRIKLYNKLKTNHGLFNISSNTNCISKSSSKIIINKGNFNFGFPISKNAIFPAYNNPLIKLSENSTIIINGNVYFGEGCSIIVGKNATLTFEGENNFAHNTNILCNNQVVFGYKSSSSWNCYFIDWDGHEYLRDKPNSQACFNKSLIIGQQVGIQMNVVIPKGISIGNNSIIGANTVLRENVKENSLAFTKNELIQKEGYKSGII